MCRNIKTLTNLEPPATEEEIRASAIQFVRKVSGTTRPSSANQAAFDRAVDEVTVAAQRLVSSLTTKLPPRNREEEARKARERARARFSPSQSSDARDLPGGVGGRGEASRAPRANRANPS